MSFVNFTWLFVRIYRRTPHVGFKNKPETPCKGLDKYKITNLYNTSQIYFTVYQQKAKVNFILRYKKAPVFVDNYQGWHSLQIQVLILSDTNSKIKNCQGQRWPVSLAVALMCELYNLFPELCNCSIN